MSGISIPYQIIDRLRELKDQSNTNIQKVLEQLNALPFNADSFEVTARNANDDPTTIEYSRDGNLVKTVTITYTAGGDVDTYTAT